MLRSGVRVEGNCLLAVFARGSAGTQAIRLLGAGKFQWAKPHAARLVWPPPRLPDTMAPLLSIPGGSPVPFSDVANIKRAEQDGHSRPRDHGDAGHVQPFFRPSDAPPYHPPRPPGPTCGG